MPKLSIETHTRLIREVKWAHILLNPLIGLKGIKEIKYKNRVSWIESAKVINGLRVLSIKILNGKCQSGQ